MAERRVSFSEDFAQRIEELLKKYRRIEKDIGKFVDQLKSGATPGDQLQGTGRYIAYKARIASSDMQRGKSGGFRVVYYLRTETHILLLTIFSKTEHDNISAARVMYLIERALEEIEAEESDSAADTLTTPDPDKPPAE